MKQIILPIIVLTLFNSCAQPESEPTKSPIKIAQEEVKKEYHLTDFLKVNKYLSTTCEQENVKMIPPGLIWRIACAFKRL
jgi:PBP1b-binding outer membrane lipoprotein LpoB